MNYNKINNIAGWLTFAIAAIVYIMTMAPTASFWDCGEFIACANELEVPHPPGAPLFLLIGRLFSMLALGDVEKVSVMMNLFSALSSAFTVLFTFWITTALGRKMMGLEKEEPNMNQSIVLVGAGLVAGLACTFADSVWFNAVEAEVYALSSFFTAAVVWLMFKWEARADQKGNERWIILIAYVMGLSIGVHLLNLLTIPALAFIYYFRKYNFSWQGFIITGVVSVVMLGVVQTGLIVKTFDFAAFFEHLFTGSVTENGTVRSGMGMPFGTGFVFAMILLLGALVFGTFYSHKKGMVNLNVGILAVIMIYIGISSYAMIPIRSKANPSIDENNPENTLTFLSYMKREQYGDRPLLYGPLYNARMIGAEEGASEYILEEGTDRYVYKGKKDKPKYAPGDMKLFPRMYDANKYNSGPHSYSNYVSRVGERNQRGENASAYDDQPTAGEDMVFFFRYQVWHMYMRYFLWNFVGREGDLQDFGWESGFNFGEISDMPDSIKDDPSKNHYYFLPLLLGLLGLFWQAKTRKYDAVVVGLLFFFTGLAIILYLNQPPAQPRERDYSFAGSFQTFAIWIGLGVIALNDLLKRFLANGGQYIAVAIGLLPPLIMGAQNWDDHSRSGRYIAPDSAYNLLNSLAPNAVLFTNGDNDTFPLWYLQEVEGVRTDVRVLCLSYVNTDWYIEQMYRQMNDSPPLPLSIPRSEYVGTKNQAKYYSKKSYDIQLPANAQQMLADEIIDQDEVPHVQNPMKWKVNLKGAGQNRFYLLLADRLILNLLENVAKGGWERPVYFANTVNPSSFLGLKNFFRVEGLAYRILPVRNPDAADMFHQNYGRADVDLMEENLIETFKYRNLDKEGVYYDENIRRMVGNYHRVFYRLSKKYIEMAKKARQGGPSLNPNDSTANNGPNEALAQEYMNKAKEVMMFGREKFPYEAVEPDLYYIAKDGVVYDELGMKEEADAHFDYVRKRARDILTFYGSHNKYHPKGDFIMLAMQMMVGYYQQTGQQAKFQEVSQEMQELERFRARIGG